MKKILAMIGTALFFLPGAVFAGSSITFSPASPQTYDGTSDISIDCDADGNGAGTHLWVAFSPVGVHMGSSAQSFNACNSGTFVAYGGGGSGQYTHNFQVDAGQAGTVTWLYLSYVESGYNECTNGTDTLAQCMLENAYTVPGSISVTYDLSAGGGGGGGSGTTTPVTVIDDPAEQIFDALMLFLLSMFGMIWFMRKH